MYKLFAKFNIRFLIIFFILSFARIYSEVYEESHSLKIIQSKSSVAQDYKNPTPWKHCTSIDLSNGLTISFENFYSYEYQAKDAHINYIHPNGFANLILKFINGEISFVIVKENSETMTSKSGRLTYDHQFKSLPRLLSMRENTELISTVVESIKSMKKDRKKKKKKNSSVSNQIITTYYSYVLELNDGSIWLSDKTTKKLELWECYNQVFKIGNSNQISLINIDDIHLSIYPNDCIFNVKQIN